MVMEQLLNCADISENFMRQIYGQREICSLPGNMMCAGQQMNFAVMAK